MVIRRILAAAALAAAVVTCRDAMSPPGATGVARLAVAPVIPSDQSLASFGLAIDRVRFRVVRPGPSDTLVDTTVALRPDADVLDLDLRIPLIAEAETLDVSVSALAGTIELFRGSGPVVVRSGAATPPPTEIAVTTYVGPGAGVDSLAIVPKTPFILFNDSLRLQVQAFQGGVPVTQFYVAWTTSDTSVAKINSFGTLRAPAARTSVWVRARTPSGVTDSVSATFVPVPTQLLLITGDGQTASVGQPLATQLEVEVRAADNLPVGGIGVRFRSLSGGTPADTTVTSDAGGRARVTGTLGPLPGAQTFQATIPAFPAVSALGFSATALSGVISPARSLITVSSATVVSGNAVTLRLQGKDGAGNNITTGGATVVFAFSGGASTGNIGTTADSGNGVYTATFTGVLAGAATSIGATIDGNPVTTARPTVTVTPGAPAQLAFTVPPGIVAAGIVMTPAIQVAARDLAGNLAPSFGGDVTIAIGTNPVGGLLAGTANQTASGGVATFSDLAIDLPGIGYTLTASAAGLAGATTAAFDVVAPTGTIYWASAVSGAWSNPANWTGGVVPGPTETAAITIPGTYTVTLDVGDTIAGLQVGGSSGAQTLLAQGKTLLVSGTSQINANGVLWLKGSTLAGGILSNGGQVLVEGSTSLTTAVTSTAGSLFRVQGNNSFGGGQLTVATGFTNNGAIVLTDTISTYGAVLNVSSGTLTNAAGGTIDAAVGAGGGRTLSLQLDNQGTVTLHRDLILARASAAHSNSGTIDLVTGNFSINQSGTSPSFTNTGTIALAAGDSVKLSSGAFNYNGGSITGGVLSLSSVAVTAPQSFSTAAAGLSLTSSTWGGSGTLTIAPATTVAWRSSSIASALVNQGSLLVTGSSAFNGPVTNAAGAMLQLEGNNSYGAAVLGVAGSFTNDGAIVLTDIVSTYGAQLSMPGATLTNAPGATIQSAVGAGGPRTLGVELNNQGTVTLNRPLTLARASAAHVNSGTIDVVGGNLAINQSGTSPSFTNTGTITIAAGDSVTVTSGALNLNGGAIGGGTLALSSTAVTSPQPFSTATAALALTGTTWSGAGTVTVDTGTTVFWRASSITAPLVNLGTIVVSGSSGFNGAFTNAAAATLQLQGNNSYGTAVLGVATSFTNDGAIVLTDVVSTYGAQLNMPSATLTNAPGATIQAAVGANGGRTLGVQLDNQGTVTLNRGLTLARSAAAHTNSGTIDVIGGSLTISQTGTSPSFTNTGTINIAAGDSLKVSAGTFNYSGGTIGGSGTFDLSSTTVNAAQSFSTATTALGMTSSTWGGTGTLTVAPSTALILRASTINVPLANQGSLTGIGSSAVNGALTNAAGATLRVEGNNGYGVGNLTVASGFTNAGAIDLTDIVSTYGATLHVTAGTLVNGSGGAINALAGAGGPRTLDAQLDNQGTLNVTVAPAQALTINKTSAAHTNSGTIAVSAGDLTISQGGTTPSFTNTGAITVAAGDTVRVNGGAFTHNAGTIGGAGAFALSSVTSGAFNLAHTIASMKVTSSTVSFATGQSTGATGFDFTSSTVNGPGALTNDVGKTLAVRASTINTALDNQGTLIVNGTSTFNGALTTGTGSLVRVQGNGSYSTANATVLNGFTNAGTIELTDTTSTYGAILNVTNGVLTNAAGATIAAVTGAGGPRTVGATLDNQGALSVALPPGRTLTLNHAGAHQNSGTIDLTGGDLTVTQSGAGTFTTNGAVNIGTGDTLTISGGGFTLASGTLGGAGTMVLSSVNPAAFNVAHSVAAMLVTSSNVSFATAQNTGATGFAFTSSTVNGPGTLTNDVGKSLTLRATTVAAPLVNLGTLVVNGTSAFTDTFTTAAGSLLRVQGNGTFSSAVLNTSRGFLNNGAIELTDTTSTYGATLTVGSGTLINGAGATITALTGAGGPRNLNGVWSNQGAVTVALAGTQAMVLAPGAGASNDNSGTIDVTGGDLRINQTGSGAKVTNNGAITIATGDTLTVSSGSFVYGGGSLGGSGTLVLSGDTASFAKPHTLAAITLTNSIANFAVDQTTASTKFDLTSSTIGGTGIFTNAAGQTLAVRASTFQASLVNQGTLLVTGASNINGPFNTTAGSLLRLQGGPTYSTANLSVATAGGLLNNATIELTDTVSTYGAVLKVTGGTLVNSGTIDAQLGAAGPRTLDAMVDNKGTITVSRPLSIIGANAAHTNSGLIKANGADITVQQSGGNPSFTNQSGGAIDISAGRTFRVTAGPVTNALGGQILGAGTLDVGPGGLSNSGDLVPGGVGSTAILTVVGGVTFQATGSLSVDIAGSAPGTQYDRLAVTGAVSTTLAGILNASVTFAPGPQQQFDVLTASAGRTGRFATLNAPLGWIDSYLTNTVTLTAP